MLRVTVSAVPSFYWMRFAAESAIRMFVAETRRSLSGFVQNAFDLADGNPIDIGDLRNRHAVSRQGPDAPKLRP